MEYRKFSSFIEKVQYGYTAAETSTENGDAKYLRITDIVPYFVDKDRVPFCAISNETKAKYLVKENDLLIARTGATTGYNLIVPKDFQNYVFASYLVRFYYKQNELFPGFLKHVLKSKQYYGFVNNYVGGSAQPGMNPKAFGRFDIPYFDIVKQKRIASILFSYDNLIENNNKQIKVLEQMAESLYKEWFVRFRFPGHETAKFENGSPKGWRSSFSRKPKVWHYGTISELGVFIRGKNITSDQMVEGTVPVISAGIEPSGFHNESNVKGKSITISASGANAGYMKYNLDDIWAADCSYMRDNDAFWFIYHSLKYIQLVIRNLQCGAAQPHVYPKSINKLCIVIPDDQMIKEYCRIVTPFYEEIGKLQKENDNLVNQRDLLLPRLMSGKL